MSGRTPHRRPGLMGRAMRERWAIPGSLRRPLVERLGEIVRDPEAPHRDVLSAVSAILTANKINLANIALTIKVQRHEDLEERVTEIERKVGLGRPKRVGKVRHEKTRIATRSVKHACNIAMRVFLLVIHGQVLRVWTLYGVHPSGTLIK